MESFSHDQVAGRFEASRDGRYAGVAHYTLSDGVAVFDHTEVPTEFEGQGVAGRLVGYAMDEVRAKGWRVRPVCPYVKAWFERSPEYSDLLA